MMDGPITQLRLALDGLKSVFLAAQSLWSYVANHPGSPDVPAQLHDVIGRHRALRLRSFESDAGAVLLYGCIERFVEDLLRALLERLTQRVRFSSLPGAIRESHLRRSAELMLNERALKRLGETGRGVLERAWTCDSAGDPYQLNIAAFTKRESNMRQSVIDTLFAGVGYVGASAAACAQRPFMDWYRQEHGVDPPQVVDAALAMLTELVELRNEVAHGSPTSSLALQDMIRMVGFLAAFGESLHLVARAHAIGAECDVKGQSLPTPLRIYNNEIVCFDLNGRYMKPGDWLVAAPGAGVRRCGRVEEIQVSGKAVTSVDSRIKPVQVGVRTDMHAKEGWTWMLVTE